MRLVIAIASLVLATIPSAVGHIADPPDHCGAGAWDPECAFHCHSGRKFYVQLFGDIGEDVAGSASCGGRTVECSGVGLGDLSQVGVVCESAPALFTDLEGECRYEAGDAVNCGEIII